MGSLKQDIQSPGFKKLVENEALRVLDMCTLEDVDLDWDNFHNVFTDIEKLSETMKGKISKKRLDRHKILATITVSILRCKPMTLKGKSPQKVSYYSNEIFALNLCNRLLRDNIISDFARIHSIKESVISTYLDELQFPKPTKDEYSVEYCLIQGLLHIRSKLDNYGYSEDHLVGCVLMISHIYFYMELINWGLLEDKFRTRTEPLP